MAGIPPDRADRQAAQLRARRGEAEDFHPRLFRQHQPDGRADRQSAGGGRPAEAGRQHGRRLHLRPRLVPGRAWPVAEDAAVRGIGPRADDDLRSGAARRTARFARGRSSWSICIRRWPICAACRRRRASKAAVCKPLLEDPAAAWDRPAFTQVVHGPKNVGPERPHRAMAIHRMGRRQEGSRAVRSTGRPEGISQSGHRIRSTPKLPASSRSCLRSRTARRRMTARMSIGAVAVSRL